MKNTILKYELSIAFTFLIIIAFTTGYVYYLQAQDFIEQIRVYEQHIVQDLSWDKLYTINGEETRWTLFIEAKSTADSVRVTHTCDEVVSRVTEPFLNHISISFTTSCMKDVIIDIHSFYGSDVAKQSFVVPNVLEKL